MKEYNTKKIKQSAFFIAFAFWAPLAFCDASANALQAKLNAIRTMTASFSQTVKAKKRAVMHSTGTMALSRPGRLRWQTRSPMPQLIIADGRRLWIYDRDLEQVTVKRQGSGLGGAAGLFLNGYGHNVARDFNVTAQQNGGRINYDLRSKSHKGGFSRVRLAFAGNTLVGIELYDQLGQYTTVRLSNVKTNINISMSQFQFKAPKGVDVVNQ